MAEYLITGGCGFIGTHLLTHLIAAGHSVRVLDDLSLGSKTPIHDNCELVIGDVGNRDLVRHCMQGMDGCFHLAAKTPMSLQMSQWGLTHQTNLGGAINVFDTASHSDTPVVYASSSAVYGDNAALRLKEQDRLRPLTASGADKLSVELHARVATVAHGVATTGLRLFNVYGPGQNPALPHGNVVSLFVDRLLRGKAMHVYGDGEQIRDFIYVEDAIRFLCQAMDKIGSSSTIYNVCSGEPVSINQLYRSIMSILDISFPVLHKPARKGDIRGFAGDPSHAAQALGVSARYRLAEGLYRYIQHEQKMDAGTYKGPACA